MFALAWPVMAEQTLRTLMRTVDVVVIAAISPAAVVAASFHWGDWASRAADMMGERADS